MSVVVGALWIVIGTTGFWALVFLTGGKGADATEAGSFMAAFAAIVTVLLVVFLLGGYLL